MRTLLSQFAAQSPLGVGLLAAAVQWVTNAGPHLRASAEKPGRDVVCSIVPAPGLKYDGKPYALATVLKDTALAGAGPVRVNPGGGHFGPAADRTVFGQMVRLEQVGGHQLRRTPGPGDTVVLVPWDYGPDCSPRIWTRSAHWLEVKTEIFINATLRDSLHWSGPFPIFDVFVPEAEVFPSTLRSPVFSDVLGSLSSADLFRFYEIMPTLETVQRDGWDGLKPIRQWAEANLLLSESFPIGFLIGKLVNQADLVRAANLRPPMAGTYRVVLRYPDTTETVLFLRTAASARGFYELYPREGTRRKSVWDGSLGFELGFWLAEAEAGLPDTVKDSEVRAHQWGIAWPNELTTDWQAQVSPDEFFSFLASSPAADSVLDAYSQWFDVHWDAGTEPAFTGVFRDSAGHWLFSQNSPPIGRVAMAIEGIRLSSATVAWLHSDEPQPFPREAQTVLPQSERTDVRVRIWDEMLGRYIEAKHQLRRPDGSVTYSYTVGTKPEGWGESFWLPPGHYAIQISEYPCGGQEQFIIGEIHRSFTAVSGEDVDLTIRVDPRKLKIAQSYRNPGGSTCSKAP